MTNEQYLKQLKKELQEQESMLENSVVLIDIPAIEKRIEELRSLIILFTNNKKDELSNTN